MARPREFDVDEAADRARDAFWAGGYEGTNLTGLCHATGQSVGSLYKAFGSKEALHRAGLGRYLAAAREQAERALAAPDPVEGLRAWLDAAAEAAAAPPPHAGCYAVLAEVELAASSPEVAALLREHDETLARLVADVLRRTSLRPGLGADHAATTLLVVVKGLQVQARSGVSRDRACRLVRTALALVLADPLPDSEPIAS